MQRDGYVNYSFDYAAIGDDPVKDRTTEFGCVRLGSSEICGLARVRLSHTSVVFLTAYGQHALDAFDVGAANYLLKPLNRGRLLGIIERLKARMDHPTVSAGARRQAAKNSRCRHGTVNLPN
jgi:DNA-binding LytR/AlgR family response regulator